MKKRILISTGGSGGHVVPGTIFYEHLHDKFDIFMISDLRGVKFLNKEKYNIEILDVTRISKNIFLIPFQIFSIFYSLLKAIFFIKKKNIDIVISTGGYMSVPLCFASKILNIEPGREKYVITFSPKQNESDQIKVVTRSLLGVLFYLSQSVEAPEQDIKDGKVTRTLKENGDAFDWRELTGGLLQIKSKPHRPENATLMVFYRDTWFYIDDSDLNSKSTFSLLTQIYSLQSGSIKSTEPILTIGVGSR